MYSNARCHVDARPTSERRPTTDDRCYAATDVHLLGDFSSLNSYRSTVAKASALFAVTPRLLKQQPMFIIPDLTSSLLRLHCWPHSQTPSHRYFQEISECLMRGGLPLCQYLVIHSSLICFNPTYPASKYEALCTALFSSAVILNQRVKWLLPKAHSCSTPWGWTGRVGSLL